MQKATATLLVLLVCDCAVVLSGVLVEPRACTDTGGDDHLDSVLQTASSNMHYTLQPGEHCLRQYHLVQDLVNVTFQGPQQGQAARINCTAGSGLAFHNMSQLHLAGLTIDGCGVQRNDIASFVSTVTDTVDYFFEVAPDADQYVAVLLAVCDDFLMEHSTVSNTEGLGLLGINVGGNSTLNNVTFERNVPIGCFGPLTFNFTEERVGGGAIFYYHDALKDDVSSSSLEIINCKFLNNSYCGYALTYVIYAPWTDQNLVNYLGGGGGLSLVLAQLDYEVNVTVNSSTFRNNTAGYGCGVHMQLFTGVPNSQVLFDNCLWESNGVDRSLSGHRSFSIVGSALSFVKDLVQPNFSLQNVSSNYAPSILLLRNSLFMNNTAFAGVVEILSLFNFIGVVNNQYDAIVDNCTFQYNFASFAPGIYFTEWKGSVIQLGTNVLLIDVTFSRNTLNSGPAFTTQQSGLAVIVSDSMNVTIAGNSIISDNLGTGLAAVSTSIIFKDNVTFFNNTGSYGGAMSLAGTSVMFVAPNTTVAFYSNNGALGGAIYVNIYSSLGTDQGLFDCFLYFGEITLQCNLNFGENCEYINEGVLIMFEGNQASEGGMIYGSTLNTCPWSRSYRAVYGGGGEEENVLELMYRNQDNSSSPFHFDRPPNERSAVSTLPTRISVPTTSITVAPGIVHPLNVTTYNGLNELVPTLITSIVRPADVTAQVSESDYLLLSYNDNASVITNLQVFGEVNETDAEVTILAVPSHTQVTLKVNITDCPDGYRIDSSVSNVTCVCHTDLLSQNYNCTDDAHIIVPYGRWIGRNGGELVYGVCNLGYCSSRISIVPVTVGNSSDLYDVQCNPGFSRSGLACGRCKDGYSVVFGSNRCLQCTNNSLWLIVLFAIYGVLLILFIVFLRFTITEGFLNGLLFFSNILTTYLPYSSRSEISNLYIVFFWLSLKVGYETCFFDGMTALASTALQFIFPLYLYVLLVVIILLSRWSARFSRWLSSRGFSPTKLFATVMVMTYSSLLETCINVLSFTKLRAVETNVTTHHWGYDQSVRYFHGPHAALGVFAILLLVFFLIPAPFLWMFPSVTLHFRRLQKWKPLYDAVWAPLKPRFRFWVSLRLILRIFPLLIINFTGVPVNLILMCYFLLILLFVHGTLQPFQGFAQNAVDSLFQVELISITLLSLYFTTLNFRESEQLPDREAVDRSNKAISVSDATQDTLIILSIIIYVYITLGGVLLWHLVLRFPKIKELAIRVWNTVVCRRCRVKQRKQSIATKPTTTIVSVSPEPTSYGSTNSDEGKGPVITPGPTVCTFAELREPLLESSGLVDVYQAHTQ